VGHSGRRGGKRREPRDYQKKLEVGKGDATIFRGEKLETPCNQFGKKGLNGRGLGGEGEKGTPGEGDGFGGG